MAELAVLKGSQNFLHTFIMALYHEWDVKMALPTYVLQLFSLISDSLGSVKIVSGLKKGEPQMEDRLFLILQDSF